MISHYFFYTRKIAQLYLNLACVDAAGVPADQSGKCVGSELVLEQRFLPRGPARKQGACGHHAQPPEFPAHVSEMCAPRSQPPRPWWIGDRAAWDGAGLEEPPSLPPR